MEPDRRLIQVEVAYARPDSQTIVPLELEEGSTVADAIDKSGIVSRYPEIDLSQNKVGIFGKPTKLDATLRANDRVEIYRPLIADPKEVRRQRAAEGRTVGKQRSQSESGDNGSA